MPIPLALASGQGVRARRFTADGDRGYVGPDAERRRPPRPARSSHPSWARKPRPEPCPVGRFLTADGAHVVANVVQPANETIVLEPTSITIEPGVPAHHLQAAHHAQGHAHQGDVAELRGLRRAGEAARRASRAGTATRSRARCASRARSRSAGSSAPRARRSSTTSPLDPRSPWPKFRRTSRQDGRSPVRAVDRRAASSGRSRPARGSSARRSSTATAPSTSARPTAPSTRSPRTARCAGRASPARSSTPPRSSTTAAASTSARATASSTRSTARPATPVWTFAADDPAVNGAFINWFEGNVAIGADGTLYVPNDNFFTYALERDDARGALDVQDRRPDVVAAGGRRRDRPPLHRQQQPARRCSATTPSRIDAATGATACGATAPTARSPRARCSRATAAWSSAASTASCARTTRATGAEAWPRRSARAITSTRAPASCPTARSCSRPPTAASTGSIPRPARCAGSSTRATRSARRRRSTATGNVYVGAGDGRLYVLNPDGTLRWSMQLIDARARRPERVAGARRRRDRHRRRERARSSASRTTTACAPRRRRRALPRAARPRTCPSDGARALLHDPVRPPLDAPPGRDRAEPAAHVLALRARGRRHGARAHRRGVDDGRRRPAGAGPHRGLGRPEVHHDRAARAVGGRGRRPRSRSRSTGNYLVNPDARRAPLLRRRGRRHVRRRTSTFDVRAVGADDTLPLPVPGRARRSRPACGSSHRLAAPLPTILPSYNQIGFDSLHYLIGLVEGDAPGARDRVGRRRQARRGREHDGRRSRDARALPARGHARRRRAHARSATGFAIEFNADPHPVRVLPHRDARRRAGQRAREPGAERLAPSAAASRSTGRSSSSSASATRRRTC